MNMYKDWFIRRPALFVTVRYKYKLVSTILMQTGANMV